MGKLFKNLVKGDKIYDYCNGELDTYTVIKNEYIKPTLKKDYFNLYNKNFQYEEHMFAITLENKKHKEFQIFFNVIEANKTIMISSVLIRKVFHVGVAATSIDEIKKYLEEDYQRALKEKEKVLKYTEQDINNAKKRLNRFNKTILLNL